MVPLDLTLNQTAVESVWSRPALIRERDAIVGSWERICGERGWGSSRVQDSPGGSPWRRGALWAADAGVQVCRDETVIPRWERTSPVSEVQEWAVCQIWTQSRGRMSQERVDTLFCLTIWKNNSQVKKVSRWVSLKKPYTYTSNQIPKGLKLYTYIQLTLV